jgi:hypothetical protein
LQPLPFSPQTIAGAQVGNDTLQRPPSHDDVGQTSFPSGQTVHGARNAGQSASLVHSAGSTGSQIPGQSAPTFSSQSSPGWSTQANPGGQVIPAKPPQRAGSEQGGASTMHVPASHREIGQLADPSAHTWHTAGSAGQSPSVWQSPVASG